MTTQDLLKSYQDKKVKIHKQVNQAIITHDKDLQAYSEGRILEIDQVIYQLSIIVDSEKKINTILENAF